MKKINPFASFIKTIKEAMTGSFKYYNFIGLVETEFTPDIEGRWETDDAMWINYKQLNILNPKHFGLTSLLENEPKILNYIK